MISICRACSHTICRHRIGSSRLTHSSFVRLLEIGLRVIRAVPFSSSFIRYEKRGGLGVVIPQAAFPIFQRLAVLRPAHRQSDTEDGTMISLGVSICGRYRWRTEAFHIRGSFISIRFCSRSPIPFRPALRLSDTKNGTGLILLSLVPLSVVSRSYRWCSEW